MKRVANFSDYQQSRTTFKTFRRKSDSWRELFPLITMSVNVQSSFTEKTISTFDDRINKTELKNVRLHKRVNDCTCCGMLQVCCCRNGFL